MRDTFRMVIYQMRRMLVVEAPQDQMGRSIFESRDQSRRDAFKRPRAMTRALERAGCINMLTRP